MSKGLEALHHPRIELARIDISAEGLHDIAYMPFYKTKQYATIEEELKEGEKKDEALKIIKTKLLVGCFSEEDNYSNYVMAIMMSGNEELKKNMMSEKEYNLIREVWL